MIDYRYREELRLKIMKLAPSHTDKKILRVLDDIEIESWNAAVKAICEKIEDKVDPKTLVECQLQMIVSHKFSEDHPYHISIGFPVIDNALNGGLPVEDLTKGL